MRTVALVGCCREKSDRPAPARELYLSPLFKKALAYAERIASPGCVYVLSAQHGVLRLDQEVAPYDLSLRDFDSVELSDYRHVTGIQLEDALGMDPLHPDWAGIRVVLLASDLYLPDLPEDGSVPVERPLAGLGIGQRLSWLTRQLAETRAA